MQPLWLDRMWQTHLEVRVHALVRDRHGQRVPDDDARGHGLEGLRQHQRPAPVAEPAAPGVAVFLWVSRPVLVAQHFTERLLVEGLFRLAELARELLLQGFVLDFRLGLRFSWDSVGIQSRVS
jgi:hypothetical protein